MSKFAYIVDNIVYEIIPAENPDLPGFSIEERYPSEFIAKLIECPEEVQQNWTYDLNTNTFLPPKI